MIDSVAHRGKASGMNLRRYQRGYAVVPYLSSLFSGVGATAAGSAAVSGATAVAAIGAQKLLAPKPAKAPIAPGAPTIDLAANAQQQSDRLSRRRGVLANIYGGSASGPAPSVRQTLGGG